MTRARVAPAATVRIRTCPTLAWMARATAGPSTTGGLAMRPPAEGSAGGDQRPALRRDEYRGRGPSPPAREGCPVVFRELGSTRSGPGTAGAAAGAAHA